MQKRLKVMVVDDDALVLEVAAATLESRGYLVTTRESALGTTLAIRRERPDIVLLDVHMPGLSGDSLAKVLFEARSGHEPVVILYSATDAEELGQLARSCGAAGAIEKSSDPTHLIRRLEQIVAQRIPQEAARARRPPGDQA